MIIMISLFLHSKLIITLMVCFYMTMTNYLLIAILLESTVSPLFHTTFTHPTNTCRCDTRTPINIKDFWFSKINLLFIYIFKMCKNIGNINIYLSKYWQSETSHTFYGHLFKTYIIFIKKIITQTKTLHEIIILMMNTNR